MKAKTYKSIDELGKDLGVTSDRIGGDFRIIQNSGFGNFKWKSFECFFGAID